MKLTRQDKLFAASFVCFMVALYFALEILFDMRAADMKTVIMGMF